MYVPLDYLLIVVLTCVCIFLCLRWGKESQKKLEPGIAIVTAVLTLAIYFFSDWNFKQQQKDLIAINDNQLTHLKLDLNKQITTLRRKNDSTAKQLAECQISNSYNQHTDGNGNNQNQQFGNGNYNNMVTIKGTDGSIINYNSLEKPFFEKTINVSGYINCRIAINKGEQIFIKATDSIRVGSFVGYSGPDGRESGVGGLSLEGYNIVRNFRHAVLMFKLSEEDDWKECGSDYKFKASKTGSLIFEVNDNDQSNNSGEYEVTVQKYRNSN